MPYLVTMRIVCPPSDAFRMLEMIQAPRLDKMDIICLRMEPQLWTVGESLASSFPKLRSLSLQGSLGHTILMRFPTIMELRISDHPQLATRIHDTFDSGQDGFSTLVPHLSCIMVQAKFEEPIQAFCVHRQSLGLTVPKIKIIDAF